MLNTSLPAVYGQAWSASNWVLIDLEKDDHDLLISADERMNLGHDAAVNSRDGRIGIFRLYGPLDPWFDKTWQPGEIELVK